jgi:hypothetical protein
MVLFLSFKRRDQPYFGEVDFHSCSVTPKSASHRINFFHNSAVFPRAASISVSVGREGLPRKAFKECIVFPPQRYEFQVPIKSERIVPPHPHLGSDKPKNSKGPPAESPRVGFSRLGRGRFCSTWNMLGTPSKRKCSTWNVNPAVPILAKIKNETKQQKKSRKAQE